MSSSNIGVLGMESQGVMADPMKMGIIAAIVGGLGMLSILTIGFIVVTVIHKYAIKSIVAKRNAKPTTARDGALYSGLMPQSTMGLMSSTSGQSFASNPSELFTMDKCISGSSAELHQQHATRLNKHPMAFDNPALTLNENGTRRGSSSNSEEGDVSYKPIEMIKSDSSKA